MPALSKGQQRAAAMALAAKKGEISPSKLRGAAKSMFSMKKSSLEEFASTSTKGLPMHVKANKKTMTKKYDNLKEERKEKKGHNEKVEKEIAPRTKKPAKMASAKYHKAKEKAEKAKTGIKASTLQNKKMTNNHAAMMKGFAQLSGKMAPGTWYK